MARFFNPSRLVVEKGAAQMALAQRVMDGLKQEKRPEILELDQLPPSSYPEFGERDLLITRHNGAFLKPCPGTNLYTCCSLMIIHFGLGCNLGCSYCILQAYLNTRALVLFANIEEGLAQAWHEITSSTQLRYTTGEFTDSLLLEDLTGTGARLVKLFARQNRAVLELKTKTDNIDSLIGLEHNGQTIVSFSMNAPRITAREEGLAAPLARRLAAARRLAQAGYRLAFHFDPLVLHAGWEIGYTNTIGEIFEAVPAKSIAWFSLGGFRYLPALKPIVAERHPSSRIMLGEFIAAADGKMRYPRALRTRVYQHVVREIKTRDEEACVYFCMESGRVWRDVMGFSPGEDGLKSMLDNRLSVPG